jgi:hypothetical protein
MGIADFRHALACFHAHSVVRIYVRIFTHRCSVSKQSEESPRQCINFVIFGSGVFKAS